MQKWVDDRNFSQIHAGEPISLGVLCFEPCMKIDLKNIRVLNFQSFGVKTYAWGNIGEIEIWRNLTNCLFLHVESIATCSELSTKHHANRITLMYCFGMCIKTYVFKFIPFNDNI